MQIGTFKVDNSLILAPMAGVTNHAFRHICRQKGCGLVYSEMISARGLLGYTREEIKKLAFFIKMDKPIAVQFFGSDPKALSEAAKVAEAVFGADIIDINMACPARKIIRNKEGAWLMRDPLQASRILEKTIKAVNIPVTIKIRKGWEENPNAVDFALMAQEIGVQGISIHGRTIEQGFSGKADWDIIRELKERVEIPVIGSGDIWEPSDIIEIHNYCKCDGVMVARGAFGNPWIFSRALMYMRTGTIPPPPAAEEKAEKALEHLALLIEEKGRYSGVREMRKHAHWYLKYLHGSSLLKERVNMAASEKDFEDIFNFFRNS